MAGEKCSMKDIEGRVMPQRIQRKRTKGWRMPEGAVYVGRPTKWGNPFRVGNCSTGGTISFIPIHQTTLERTLDAYRDYLTNKCTWLIEDARRELHGKDLACWCPVWECDAGHEFAEEIRYSRVIKYCPTCGRALRRSQCHADILLELANQ